jgi:hypothetical protein
MYGVARVKKAYDSVVHHERPPHKPTRGREDYARLANVRLSRFEYALLALDWLIRRIANDHQRPQDNSNVLLQHH